MHQKKHLVEILPAASYYTRHALKCKDIAEYIALANGNPHPNPNGLDIECMFKFDFHDCGFTGKWLGNTIYEFGIDRHGKFVPLGRIFEVLF
jgi:hypothetical protein